MTLPMPFLAMVRMAEVDTLRVIHSPVSGMKNFLSCKFGLNRRLVLTLEWETWLPLMARFPVKSQTLDMGRFFGVLDFGGYFWGDDFLIR